MLIWLNVSGPVSAVVTGRTWSSHGVLKNGVFKDL